MRELVSLLNVFCLLSLLAVGGGSAVLPQMEHETVTVHQWVTADDFATIYSLGQMAPGPNMSMVGLIGFKAANHAGMSDGWAFAAMLVVLLAFYLPSSFLTYAVSHVWDSFKENPWRDAVQRGMAPITIGLMLAGTATVINLALGMILLHVGRKRQSPVLRANGQHVLSDVYTSIAVLIALALVHFTGWPWWDPIMAVLAATNILFTGIKLIKESLGGLMDAAEPATEAKIRELLDGLKTELPFRYHHLRHRHSGHTHWVELHLVFDDQTTVLDAHETATLVEEKISALLAPNGRIITHLEPRSAEEKDEIWEGPRA